MGPGPKPQRPVFSERGSNDPHYEKTCLQSCKPVKIQSDGQAELHLCCFCMLKKRLFLGTAQIVCLLQMSRVMRKPTFWFPTRSDTNQAVQLQKIARGWKFQIYKVEGLYYLCSENKGADQLRGYREADLRLCYRKCKTLVFS